MAESKKYEITVVPKAAYLADQSDPSRNQYAFAYTITVTNTGSVPAQLLSPALDHHRQRPSCPGSEGPGRRRPAAAVEARRELRVHERREPADRVGTMRGTYQMVAEDGHAFEAEIPVFTLSVPRVLH